ncbi:MAG: hypothetical protein JWQ20_1335 [Conexibacter sp.]|nr:hypothetical protein [Conexibacter sp.]
MAGRREVEARRVLRVRVVQVALALVGVCALLALSLAISGRSTEGARASAVSAGKLAPESRGALVKTLRDAELVPAMSTPTSRTYRRRDGSFVSRIFARPPSYRDAQGTERLVDTTLRPVAGGGFSSTGEGWTSTFPRTLADPVRVVKGDAWFSMQLRDAAGLGDAEGSVLTYRHALPGADVVYRSTNEAVGEDIKVSGPDALSKYVFTVRASAGVKPERVPGGAIAFRRSDGKELVSLAPSYAVTGGGRRDRRAVATDIAAVDGGAWRVTLSVDLKWLHDAVEEHGSVTIDPTLELLGAARDCALSSDLPDTSYCADTLWVGYNGDHDHHSLVKWDVSAIPQEAVALWADFGLYETWHDDPDAAKDVSIHRMRRDWTNAASWNSYDGVHKWTTPGGDFETEPAAVADVPADHDGWVDWFATDLAQRWIEKSVPNYGVAFKDLHDGQTAAEKDFHSTESTVPAQAPELDIIWAPRTGLLDEYTFDTQALSSKANLNVNVANGNLVLATKDISSPGVGGLDLEFHRYHNSLADPSEIDGLGVKGTASYGRDVRLQEFVGGDVAFHRGDGVIEPFIHPVTTSGSVHYDSPFDLPNATLTKDTATSTWTLDLPKGMPALPNVHQKLLFGPNGALTRVKDTANHEITFLYYDSGVTDPPQLGGITDTHGDFYDGYKAYLAGEPLAELRAPSGPGKWLWGYDEDTSVLTSAADPQGETYHYESDSSHRLTKVIAPDDSVTLITYDGTSSRVASVIRPATPSATTGPTTTFAYSGPTAPCDPAVGDIGKVIVTKPDDTVTTYCHDARDRVTYDDRPVAPVSGSTRLGLEKFWDYDSVDTGSGSQLLVNSDTGNLLWHDVPIVNPGRGLSTFVNIDYNSLERPNRLGAFDTFDPLGAVSMTDHPAYNVAGRGISIGVSGPTRLNEPLGGVGLADVRDGLLGAVSGLPAGVGNDITLTDADGTTHHFTRDPGDSKKWLAPPGVHLTLRRFASTGDALADPFWVMTRADGIAYFFNKLGYLVKTEDRVGNRLTYTYEKLDLLTGASGASASASACAAASMLGSVSGTPSASNGWGLQSQVKTTVSATAGKLCTLRVAKVRDAGNRDLTIAYKSRSSSDQSRLDSGLAAALGGGSKTIEVLLTQTASSVTDLGLLMAPTPVDKITDHAGREYAFDYTNGNLTSLIEVYNAGALAPAGDRARRWAFEYFSADDAVGAHRIKTVTEVRDSDEGGNRTTTIAYATRGGTAPVGMTATLAPSTITDRRGKVTTYALSNYGAAARELTITDARNKVWKRTVDAYGRPVKVLDPLGNATNLRWDNGTPRRNDLLKVAEGATATDPGTVKTMTYEPVGGRLLSQTSYPDGEASPDTARTTELKYATSSGQSTLRPSSDPVDDLVVDLTEIKQPRTLPGGAHVGSKFTVDTATGNVTERRDQDGSGLATSVYCNGTDCPKGLVKQETDEVGNVTTYDDFDPAGLPQTVIDPKGNAIAPGFPVPAGHNAAAADHRWLYRYDSVGNLVSASDPRNADAKTSPTTATPAAAYTTKFTYDAFDRTVEKVTPKDSANSKYITETWAYDRNGNQLSAANAGTGRSTTATFSATDQPLTVTQTAWARTGSDPRGNTYTTRPEVTTFSYDDTDLLVSRTDPRGASGVPAGGGSPNLPYTTEWTRDDAGRVVAESRHATSSVHVRALALDARGNVVGDIDAARNADPNGDGSSADARTPAQAATAAATAISTNNLAGLRTSYAYNYVDELTAQTERPAPSDATGSPRSHKYVYDADGNVVKHVLPRDDHDVPAGFTAGAGNVAQLFSYDHRDQLLTTTDPLGAATAVKRRADGKVVARTTPRGVADGTTNSDGSYKYFTAAYTYDAAGDLLTRTTPYKANQYGRAGTANGDYLSWKVSYGRDAVGDPTTIVDGRNKTIANSFLDTGQLASTSRPGWWSRSWGGASGAPDPGRHYGDPAPADAVGAPQLSERDMPVSGINAERGAQVDTTQGKFGQVDPADAPDWLPRGGAAFFGYDDDGRLTTVTDAAGSISRIDYDPVGRVVGTTQPIGANPGATLTGGGDPQPCATAGCARVAAHRYDYDTDGNLVRSELLGDTAWHNDFTYDSFDRLVNRTDPGASDIPGDWATAVASREETQYQYDGNDNLIRRVTPRGVASAAAGDFEHKFDYDSLDRLIGESNGAGNRWGYAWDVDDNLLRELTPNGSAQAPANQDNYKTLRTYDAADRMVTEQGPVVDGARDTTSYAYFPDGKLAFRTDPGASAVAGDPAVPRLTGYDYDGRGMLNRVTRGHLATGGVGFSTAGVGPRTTLTEYDADGNARRVVDPSGVTTSGSGLGQTFAPTNPDVIGDNLTVPSSTDAVHAKVYDYSDLTGVAGDAGAPTRIYQPREDTNDSVLAQRIDYDALARPQSLWTVGNANPATFTTHTSYTRLRNGWIDTSEDFATATTQVNHNAYDYDQNGSQLSWSLDPNPSAAATAKTISKIKRDYWPNGRLLRRTGVTNSGSDQTTATNSYWYDPNESLTGVRDVDHDTMLAIDHDSADRVKSVVQRYRVGSNPDTAGTGPNTWQKGRDSAFDYDQNGNVTLRRSNGILDRGTDAMTDPASTTFRTYARFAYDAEDKETIGQFYEPGRVSGTPSVNDCALGGSPAANVRCVRTTYHPSDQRRTRRQQDNTLMTTLFDDVGQPTQRRRQPGGSGSDVVTSYSFDKRGNRTADLPGVGEYTYNARDQLTSWTRGSDFNTNSTNGIDHEDWRLDYERNPDGSTHRTIDHQDDSSHAVARTRTHHYTGQRLDKVEVTAGGGTTWEAYRSNEFGSTVTVQTGLSVEPSVVAGPKADCAGSALASTDSQTTRYCYDELDRLRRQRSPGSAEEQTFSYDGLDRRDQRDDHVGATTSSSGYSYLGLSGTISRQTVPTGSSTASAVAYDYDALQAPLAVTLQAGAGTPDTHTFATDANGNPTGLESSTGVVTAADRYVYDPYGDLDPDANSALASAAATNPLRFNGFDYDSAVKTYDMQARDYRPSVGRFLQADRYEQAQSDLSLIADPLSQNRYDFVGNDPVSNVEFDGHRQPSGDDQGSPGVAYGKKNTKTEKAKQSQINTDVSSAGANGPKVYAPLCQQDPKACAHPKPKPAPKKSSGGGAAAPGVAQINALFDRTVGAAERAIIGAPKDVADDPAAAGHSALDALGVAPGVGEGFDLLNAGWYSLEGDKTNAALSAAGAVPIVGWGATAAKLGRKSIRGAAKGGDTALSQAGKRRLAKRLGDIPRSSSPVGQGGSTRTGRWWEYDDVNGQRKIVVEHPDGTVHVGVPKPQSTHPTGGPPKYYDYANFGHVGE